MSVIWGNADGMVGCKKESVGASIVMLIPNHDDGTNSVTSSKADPLEVRMARNNTETISLGAPEWAFQLFADSTTSVVTAQRLPGYHLHNVITTR